jgi:hypothetical protein
MPAARADERTYLEAGHVQEDDMRRPMLPSLAAVLLAGACGVPRLRQVPGSDVARRSQPRPSVTGSAQTCGGPRVPVQAAGPKIALGDPTGACATVTTDTVPDRPSDASRQPPRPIP